METKRTGRPPLPESERAKLRSIRLTDEHWEKLQRLGMDWLRRQIVKAKEPEEEK
jgi:hypothetical protein